MSYQKSIKRDKTDALFSELVRERADWKCEYGQSAYCGHGEKRFDGHSHEKQTLHCSHLFGRRSQGVRWHPMNAFSHCLLCHRHLEENPPIFALWASERLGGDYDKLMILANKPTKFTKFGKEILHKHYLKERKRLKELRKNGEIGRLEFYLP